jgi:hypothetical protein
MLMNLGTLEACCAHHYIYLSALHVATESRGELRGPQCRAFYRSGRFDENIDITAAGIVIDPRTEHEHLGMFSEDCLRLVFDLSLLFD